MSILVTGASGRLGSALLARWPEHEDLSGWRRHGESADPLIRQVDIADAAAVDAAFAELSPRTCVHCAAIADVDRCEADPRLAEAVNARGTANVAAAAARHGTRLVAISTDYVFDGRATVPYVEEARPNPLQVYGATKRGAELSALALEGSLVVRLPLLYDTANEGDWFRRTRSQLVSGEEVRADTLHVRQPAHVDDIAELIIALAGLPVEGLLHLAPPQLLTRYEWAGLIASDLGARPELVVGTEQEPEVPRPRRASLAIPRLEALGLTPPRTAAAVLDAGLAA